MTIHRPIASVLSVPTRSMQDVYDHIRSIDRAEGTRRDYLAQISRCAGIYNVNRLCDIPAALEEFERRWPKKGFDPERFKTADAYLAWRRKMRSILRASSGFADASKARRMQEDDWNRLYCAVKVALEDAGSPHQAIAPLHTLIDLARARNLQPPELIDEVLAQMAAEVSVSRRRSLKQAVRLLNWLRDISKAIDDLLPPYKFRDLAQIRRRAAAALPDHMEAQIKDWVRNHCGVAIDFVTGEECTALSANTAYAYYAALRKYLRTALALGVLSADLPDILLAFEEDVLRAVIRAWAGETDTTLRISAKTMDSYIRDIKVLVGKAGGELLSFKHALASQVLRKGHAESSTMSVDARKFCARVVKTPDAAITFRSIHIQFRRMAEERLHRHDKRHAIQLGICAAFAAIALWGVPLRIENMLSIRHRGQNPSLLLPRNGRDTAIITIPGEDVKNRKPITAEITRDRNRALEIIEWYMKEIRPQIPWAEQSDLLFPGWKGPQLSDAAFRNWLFEYSSALRLPMRPHNFRHGQASLYLKNNPGDFAAVARLLGDTPETVRTYYAWIDDEAELKKVQKLIAEAAGLM